MDATGSHSSNRAYYDAFSQRYEAHRGKNDPGGYHELLDELESEFVRRFGAGREILEVGCGTGLILERLRQFAKRAQGVDLSPGMLEKARARGLEVREGSATALPFPDHSFDVTCSFKVLAHVPEIELALREMVRVTRPTGTVIAEFYNPFSLRALIKRYGPAGAIAQGAHEKHVFTRYDSPSAVERLIPRGCELIASRGVRIVTPAAAVMRIGGLRQLFRSAERVLCDSPLRVLGGFWIVALKTPASGPAE
ncbi:MAG TPA: class I SAM-dependent methyltransferase [Polyangiaceae bacterium]|nr:class I SAM-dependent methyltransferase [Polyangiaceae bacterium]